MPTDLYEKRIVAFLDILGWRTLVSQSVSNPAIVKRLATMLQKLNDHYDLLAYSPEIPEEIRRTIKIAPRREQDGFSKDLQFAQFSDSIIISAKVTRLTIGAFLYDIVQLAHRHVFGGILLRGGITIGTMFHSGALAFGPALTQAYDLESQLARFPRIIIDPDHLRIVLDSPWTFDPRKRRRKIGDFPIIRKDRDGQHFLNFLTGQHLITCRTGPEVGLPLHPDLADPRRGIFEPARCLIKWGLEQFAHEPRVLEKYEWFAHYFNDCAGDYRPYGIDPIALT